MEDQTFTPDEIAGIFKISKHTVYELIKRGELNAFKVGNKMRIEQSEVDRFKEDMKAAPRVEKKNKTPENSLHKYPIKITGSHDFVIEHLLKFARTKITSLSLQPAFIGSLEGLMTLYHGDSDVAAIHLLDPASQTYNIPFINQLFVHEPITVLRLAAREQGFIVKRGNPKKILEFEDLLRKDVTFINRQKGSGTRFIFDYYISLHDIAPTDISGYSTEEWNHLATASSVSRGVGDVTFGIHSAASQLDLDFLPVTNEQFDLVFRWNDQNKEALETLINLIQSSSFLESCKNMEGYDFSELGQIIYDRH
ncbi:substrate-binding domain-containing protein [Bacillus sp. 1NLA3E]|uniref:substrate-binding domain-containing protein n=1 Tax=Bacillus sp. 1NLA3E TaxID=666686 RepID=UPI000247F26C|nr:helix-turn-helix transcriptional regulator [Bacillus sp. 1NLA3E]